MDTLTDVLSGLKRHVSSDRFGWQPYHMRCFVARPSLMKQLKTICDIFMKGDVPQDIADMYAGGALHATSKPTGGVRPLTIGELFRRIFARCANLERRDLWCKRLFNTEEYVLQYAVGLPSGSQRLHTAVKVILGSDASLAMLDIDIVNAFNTIGRRHVERAFVHLFGAKGGYDVLRFLLQFYGTDGIIDFVTPSGVKHILSKTGSQQGDPLGSIYFAVGFQIVLETIKRRCPHLHSIHAFVDNATVIGTPADLIEAVPVIRDELAKAGMKLKYCRLFARQSVSVPPSLSELVSVTHEGFNVMGAPIGVDTFVESASQSIVTESYQKRSSQLLPLAKVNAQVALLILKACISRRPLYISQLTPPTLLRRAAVHHDLHIQHLFAKICNLAPTEMTPAIVTRIHLPHRLAGFDILSMACTSLPAYVSYWHATHAWLVEMFPVETAQCMANPVGELSHVQESFRELRATPAGVVVQSFPPSGGAADGPDPRVFGDCMEILNGERFSSLALSMSPGNFAVLESMCDTEGPMAWLSVIPYHGSSVLQLSTAHLRAAVRHMLLLPPHFLANNRSIKCPGCKHDVTTGSHLLNCSSNHPGGHGWRRTHDLVVGVLQSSLRAMGVSSTVKCLGLLPCDPKTGEARILDLHAPSYIGGVSVGFDISLAHPYDSHGNPKDPTKILSDRVTTKNNKYRALCKAEHMDFEPFVLSTFCVLEDGAHRVLEQMVEHGIGRVALDVHDSPARAASKLRRRLYQLLSLSVFRSIATRFCNSAVVSEEEAVPAVNLSAVNYVQDLT